MTAFIPTNSYSWASLVNQGEIIAWSECNSLIITREEFQKFEAFFRKTLRSELDLILKIYDHKKSVRNFN